MSRKGENIYKRKDNRWEARYIKGYSADGSARYGYCYAPTYNEAKKKAADARAELNSGRAPASLSGKRRFCTLCDEWLRLNRSRLKESTYVKYLSMVEKHIKPQLGKCTVQGLSSLTVESFSHELLHVEGLSPKTVRDILTLLNSIIKYARRQIPQMQSVDVFYPKDTKKGIRVLSRAEQMRFTKYLLSDMDECKFGVLLALLTGLRIGEICALRWRDISIADRLLTVSTTMQRLRDLEPDTKRQRRTKIVFSSPKSDAGVRQIPLTDYAVELCLQWGIADESAYVLTGDSEHYIEPRTMQYRLRLYTSECGLEGVHFHVLRHTFATRCIEVGFEIKSLSEILGHTSPKFTLERYVHSSMELKRDNMNKLKTIGC